MNQMEFRSHPADFFGWAGDDEDLLFSKNTSLYRQFARQRELRKRAQEAALKEVAKSKLRRLLAYNKSFNCADIAIEDSVLLHKTQSRMAWAPKAWTTIAWARGDSGAREDSGQGPRSPFFRSPPRCRGPTEILGVDETGVTATFRSQTFKVARYCARTRRDEKDAHEEKGQTSAHGGVPWMSRTPACPNAAHVSEEVTNMPPDLRDVE